MKVINSREEGKTLRAWSNTEIVREPGSRRNYPRPNFISGHYNFVKNRDNDDVYIEIPDYTEDKVLYLKFFAESDTDYEHPVAKYEIPKPNFTGDQIILTVKIDLSNFDENTKSILGTESNVVIDDEEEPIINKIKKQ